MSLRLRPLLGALLAGSLLLAACGDDDDSTTEDTEASDTTEDTAAPDETDGTEGEGEDEIDVCALIDLDAASSITGEAFTTAEQTESDTCQVTNDEETALLQLSVRTLDEGETDESFVEDARTACDAGTEVADIDVSYAAGGFACEVAGEAALLVVKDGAGALLIGHPSDDTLTTAQVVGALNQIMQGIVSG